MKRKRKMLSILLALAMVLTFMPAIAFAEDGSQDGSVTVQTTWEGAGSVDNPYKIADVAGLKKLAADVNSGTSYSGTYFKLTQDIDLRNETEWTPIGGGLQEAEVEGGNGTPKSGADWKPFSGTFDGDGKTISNLTITSGAEDLGLFGAIKDATIKNLTVENASISSSNAVFVGAITGYAYNSTVSECRVIGDVAVSGKHFVGGAFGFVSKATINDTDMSDIDGTVEASDSEGEDGDDVGGLVGYTINNTKIEHCDVSGTAKISAVRQAGGLVGLLSASSAVDACSVEGVTVECAATDAAVSKKGETKFCYGGLAGAMHSGNIKVENSSVENVILTLAASGLSDANKGKMRVGRVTGGTYASDTFAVTIETQTGSSNTIKNVVKPSGTKAVDTNNEALIDPVDSELEEAKAEAVDEINAIDSNEYSGEAKKAVEAAKNEALNAIANAQTTDEVSNAVEKAKDTVAQQKTDLDMAKDAANKELDAVDLNKYSEPERTAVADAIAAAKKGIAAAGTIDAVNTAKTAALNAIAAQPVLNEALPKVTAKKGTGFKKKLRARWKKLSKKNRKKISGYEVQYAKDANFTDSAKIVKAGKNNKVKTIKKLPRKQTYWVRVRTYKVTNGVKTVGAWSKVKKIKTK